MVKSRCIFDMRRHRAATGLRLIKSIYRSPTSEVFAIPKIERAYSAESGSPRVDVAGRIMGPFLPDPRDGLARRGVAFAARDAVLWIRPNPAGRAPAFRAADGTGDGANVDVIKHIPTPTHSPPAGHRKTNLNNRNRLPIRLRADPTTGK